MPREILTPCDKGQLDALTLIENVAEEAANSVKKPWITMPAFRNIVLFSWLLGTTLVASKSSKTCLEHPECRWFSGLR